MKIGIKWNIHVMAHVYACRALLPDMKKRKSGYLVQVASAAGLLNQIGDAYSTTKHAAVGLAEWLAITYGRQGIGVSVLCPQAVKTNMTKGRENDVAALDGMMEPEILAQEVIKAVKNNTFLISPHVVFTFGLKNDEIDYISKIISKIKK